jgi:hypothetical protein
VLLQHAHMVVVVVVRRPFRVVDVRSRQSPRQICPAKCLSRSGKPWMLISAVQ